MANVLNQTRSHGTWSPEGKRGDDSFPIPIPAGEVFDSCVLTITGKRFNASAEITSQPSAGQTGVAQAVVHWWYDGGAQIDYRIEAFSRKPSDAPGISVRVPRFRPSTSGFQFSNTGFSERPDLVLPTGFGNIEVGKASNGLCGGMVYAARDYFEAGQPVPPGDAAPDSGPLFDFIVHRLFDSFDVPDGVRKYLELMDPRLPDDDSFLIKINPLAPHGRSWRMIVEEWPLIKSELDSGRLCPLGLVLVKSADPGMLGSNHQVMAYGYDLKGADLSLCVYDPNAPKDDSVTLTINLDQPDVAKKVKCGTNTVVSFFRTKYNFEGPPGYQGGFRTRAAFTSLANNKVVCADNAGALPLVANRDRVGPWESFEVCVVGSNKIALKSLANNKFVSAEASGAKPLIANRSRVGPWETFEIHYQAGNHVSLKSVANQKFVCAENAGAQPLIANRDAVGLWETFTIAAI